MNELDKMRIALKKFFAEKGLSQTKIAEMVGTSQQTISGLLSNRNFGKRTAQKWSDAFGLNPAWLITGEGAMLLADKERTTQQQPAELDEPAQQHEITSKKIVELSTRLLPLS